MIRPFAVLAVLALGLGATTAQEVAPPPPATDITVNPSAVLNNSPKQANMLTGFYATQAVIDICKLAIEPNIIAGMTADRERLELALSMDAAAATTAYDKVKADVEKTSPDCTDGSTDRIGVDAVTAIYSALPPPAAGADAAATPLDAPAAEGAAAPAPAPAQ